MQNIVNIIVFLLILGSIIIIHELGHFIAAKFFGVYCAQFSIGFGPKLWSKKGKETEYEIRALPFGGFVAMAGEDVQDDETFKDVPVERTLKGKKTYQKVIIFLAGVFMNFVLAAIVLLGVNMTAGQIPVNNAEVGHVMENSVAEHYGLKEGDVITQVDIKETGQTILVSNYEDIQFDQKSLNTTAQSLTMKITVDRDGKTEVIDAKVDYNKDYEKYFLGIEQATRRMTFTEAIHYSCSTFASMSVAIFVAVGQLITQFADTVTQLSGPAGIYQMTSQITESGQVTVLFNWLAMLSINVGVFNLLPIPGLDGSQVIFALIEKVIGRELPEKVKMGLQMCGLLLVIGLMVFVTYQDVLRIFG